MTASQRRGHWTVTRSLPAAEVIVRENSCCDRMSWNMSECLMRCCLVVCVVIDSTSAQKQRSTTNNEYDTHVKAADDNDIIGRYASYGEIMAWQTELSKKYPHIVKLHDIGQTYEGRTMNVIKLGTDDVNNTKWSIWIDGGIHAREHVTPASVAIIADQLVRSFESSNDEAKWLLKHIDWYLLPVLNPDGYEYSRTPGGRMWRKNRRPVSRNCSGVDLNRNWAMAWGGADSDKDPCSDQFMGERPETEPEIANVVKFLMARAEQFIAFVTFHSYGQRILTRWDHTAMELPDDHPQLVYVASKMALAMQQPYGKEYESGVASQLSYVFGGGSADWAHAVAKIRYSFLIELRDHGRYGFQLPVDQIIPSGHEAWAAVRELAAHVILNDGFTRPCRQRPRHKYRERDNRLLCSETGEEPAAMHEALVDDQIHVSDGGSRQSVISGDLLSTLSTFSLLYLFQQLL